MDLEARERPGVDTRSSFNWYAYFVKAAFVFWADTVYLAQAVSAIRSIRKRPTEDSVHWQTRSARSRSAFIGQPHVPRQDSTGSQRSSRTLSGRDSSIGCCGIPAVCGSCPRFRGLSKTCRHSTWARCERLATRHRWAAKRRQQGAPPSWRGSGAGPRRSSETRLVYV